MYVKKEIHFKITDPLKKGDTESQTFGCRHKDPEFCKFIDNSQYCAFAKQDCTCLKPSISWKKHFLILNEKLNEKLEKLP